MIRVKEEVDNMFKFIENRNKKNRVLKYINMLNKDYNIPILDINVYLKSSRFIIAKSNSVNGCFSGYDNCIYLNQDLDELSLKKVFLHEYGHAIDLYIGLHENDILGNHYFYTDSIDLDSNLKKELISLFKKKYNEKEVDYYLSKNEYFPELFAQYILDVPLEPLSKKLINDVLNKFLYYYNKNNNNEETYFNHLNKIDFHNMLSLKDEIQKK